MAINKEYQTIQIPIKDYALLKRYCEWNSLKMGKFVGELVRGACIEEKPAEKKILRVETKKATN